MLTKEDARNLIIGELARDWKRSVPDVVLVDEQTMEKEWGWVFFYTSARYLESRNPLHALFGNAPYIVNRHTGKIHVTGTAQSIEHYIAEYERTLPRR